jgi:hypothetical protein
VETVVVVKMSQHAIRRGKERGINLEMVETLMAWGDETRVGSGAASLTLSRAAVAELASEGMAPARTDKLRRLAIVVTDDGVVVTCLIQRRSGARKKRYRNSIH